MGQPAGGTSAPAALELGGAYHPSPGRGSTTVLRSSSLSSSLSGKSSNQRLMGRSGKKGVARPWVTTTCV